jgi:hypothetical protein
MFGSMLEMALRSFTDIDGHLEPQILEDGSCHAHRKQLHVRCAADISKLHETNAAITTFIYPTQQQDLKDIIFDFTKHRHNFTNDKKILICAPTQQWAEINMLFQYHKISRGLDLGLEIFVGSCNRDNIKQWGSDYKSWREMSRWQLREWLSLFYPRWIGKWIDASKHVSDDFLVLTNQEIVESPHETLRTVIEFCGAKVVTPYHAFLSTYQDRQQYVLEEYALIKQITKHTIANIDLSWQPLSIIGEAILQKHFRDRHYEWYCEGLQDLPTTVQQFKQIIYKTYEE